MSVTVHNIVPLFAHWKKRSKRDLTHISDIEKEHDKQSKKDEHMAWKEFYKRNDLWKITVHILLSHWGTFIDSTFSVKVPLNCVANCSWNFKNPEMSISEAGLCNGAILCFHSARMLIG